MRQASESYINCVINYGRHWTQEWTESIYYVPLHKKGSRDKCENYRTIALISHFSKIFLHISQERLKPFILPQIAEEQADFTPGRGTRDQLLNIRQVIEKLYEYNVLALLCFLDYTKAFDTVRWDHLWNILREMVPEYLIHLIKTLYMFNQRCVRIQSYQKNLKWEKE